MPEKNEYDFTNLTAHLTNEQRILATLERIEVLLTPKDDTPKQTVAPKASSGKRR